MQRAHINDVTIKACWLVAPMGGSPRATKCSERNLALRRDFCAPLLSNALELRDQTSPAHSGDPSECAGEVWSRNSKALKSSGAQKFLPMSHRHARRDPAVTAGAPWRLVRPKLRDNHRIRILWLCHQVPYITNYLPWRQGTNREGRPGLGSALTYAPRACRVDAVGCSAAASAAHLNVISVS